MKLSYRTLLLFGSLMMLLSVYGYDFYKSHKSLDLPRDQLSSYQQMKEKVTPFTLINQDGKKISFPESNKKVQYLAFAFSQCHAICPSLVNDLKLVHAAIGADKVQINIVTLDPENDTIDNLKAMHQRWHLPSSINVLSGSISEVTKVIHDYKIPRIRNPSTQEIMHPALIYVIGDKGKIAYSFNGASRKLLIDAGLSVIRPQP